MMNDSLNIHIAIGFGPDGANWEPQWGRESVFETSKPHLAYNGN